MPEDGVSLVLVSPDRYTPYSGMLPGLVAGHYTHDESHIDLEPLARYARAGFVREPHRRPRSGRQRRDDRIRATRAVRLRLARHRLAARHVDAGRARPRDRRQAGRPLRRGMEALRERARVGRLARLAIVGGGAGGVEVTLAIHHRLRADGGPMPDLALVTDKPNLPTAAQRTLFRKLDEAGVVLYLGQRATSFDAEGVVLESGDRVAADAIVCATPATPQPWLAASGLACDERGFVRVDDRLRSVSHAHVFAAGDCASQDGHSHPRSGVYAVRQGPPLATNLRAAATGKPLSRTARNRSRWP
jgi:selenide,water dikinase